MKSALALALLLTSTVTYANCDTTLPVKGPISVERCAVTGPDCVSAAEARVKYIDGKADRLGQSYIKLSAEVLPTVVQSER